MLFAILSITTLTIVFTIFSVITQGNKVAESNEKVQQSNVKKTEQMASVPIPKYTRNNTPVKINSVKKNNLQKRTRNNAA